MELLKGEWKIFVVEPPKESIHMDIMLQEESTSTSALPILKARSVRSTPLNQNSTMTELNNAEREILKLVQASWFKEELRHLQNNHGNNLVNNTSTITKIDHIIADGLIRVRGGLQGAQINNDAHHPVILPKTHRIVTLIVTFYQNVSGHSGLEYTLFLIREKFWIIKARSTVRKVFDGCVSCRKRQASTAEQKMASLPFDCTTPGKPPFSFIGVDCFRPLEVGCGRTTVK